jgi:hypothetical protein
VANGTGEEFAVHWQRIGYRGSIGR